MLNQQKTNNMKKTSIIILLFGVLSFGMTSCSGNSKQEETKHHEGDHNHEGEEGHNHKDGEEKHHEGDHAH